MKPTKKHGGYYLGDEPKKLKGETGKKTDAQYLKDVHKQNCGCHPNGTNVACVLRQMLVKKYSREAGKKVVRGQDYAPYYAIESEGGRIGLATCLRCGLCIIIGDKAVGSTVIHDSWHDDSPATTKKKKQV